MANPANEDRAETEVENTAPATVAQSQQALANRGQGLGAGDSEAE